MHFRIRPPNLAEKDDRSKNSTISPFYSENCFKTTRVICGKSSNEISFKIFDFLDFRYSSLVQKRVK